MVNTILAAFFHSRHRRIRDAHHQAHTPCHRTVAGAFAASAMPAHAELAATGEPPAARQAWKAETVAEGVRQPWGIAWLGEGRALVTSKRAACIC
jgi:glucose/arabinose dehydrogenase